MNLQKLAGVADIYLPWWLKGQPGKSTHLHIATSDDAAAKLIALLKFVAGGTDILSFPAWDCLPYDRASPKPDVTGERVETLYHILNKPAKQQQVIVTTVAAIVQRLMPKDALAHGSFIAKSGGAVDADKLQHFLVHNGYVRSGTVRESGEFAIRGGIIDIFPSGAAMPVRLDLLGTQLESLSEFDPLTQRSTNKIDQLQLLPAREVLLNDETVANFRSGYRELFGMPAANDSLYATISDNRPHAGMEHWLPLFYNHLDTLFDYLPNDATISFDYQLWPSITTQITHIEDFYKARKDFQQAPNAPIYKPLKPDRMYLSADELKAAFTKYATFEFSPFNAEAAETAPIPSFAHARGQRGNHLFLEVESAIKTWQTAGKRVLIAGHSAGSLDRLTKLFTEHGTHLKHFKAIEHWPDMLPMPKTTIAVTALPLDHGFSAPDFVLLTEEDILGDRIARAAPKRSNAKFIQELSSLSPGDLVVHADHGVGRFVGLETLTVGGAAHDCLQLIYHGDDKLYVPVENLDVLTRYGSVEDTASLDRLGGAHWQARKATVKKRLKDMAAELIKIAAARALHTADEIHLPDGSYDDFCARFPYAETDDQIRAIDAVIEDLASGRPTDRLVVGDVGFGKTEVALRAAFAAAMNGVQVAMVAPTTLLARQHFINFTNRFKGFPLKIAQLSRLASPKDVKQTKAEMADGKMDIVIGTHALLAKGISFKNLGLLIIDEEQRFGVKQKEALKQLASNIHVLTLTATPIPRTLQMALTGVREMSMITTPPVDRLAVRTFVMPFDPLVVREAMMREHYRGGQSFVVCPRVSDIADLAENLKTLVPELRVISAHGQLSATELENRMQAFTDGEYDVLLATNIIESGLDIPRANTIILHRADLFGLAQLYQLRGRIGRGKLRGYAYLTWRPEVPLPKSAQARLEVIGSLDTLGAGFQLASHDMDLRGSGNLLGEEQSGHIKEVGIELFQQMLEEAVQEAHSQAPAKAIGLPSRSLGESWSPNINLGMPVLIPENYVTELDQRMNLYRRLAAMQSNEELESFAAELVDRFGPTPEEVQNLLAVMRLKQICRRANIGKLDAGPKGAVIQFHQDTFHNVPALLQYVQKHAGNIKLRPDQRLVVTLTWDDPIARLKGLSKIAGQLAEIAV